MSSGSVQVFLPERRTLVISIADESLAGLESSLPSSGASNFRTIALGNFQNESASPARLRKVLDGDHGEIRGRAAVDLVRTALEVVRQASGSDGFFDSACSAAAEMIDLDRVMVLLYDDGKWRQRAIKVLDPEISQSGEVIYSEGLISRVLSTARPRSMIPTTTSTTLVLR